MKKYLALILVLVMCLSLCACGKKIELTADNASKYLDIYTVKYMDHSKSVKNSSDLGWLGNYWKFQFRTEGVSTNFNYDDICIQAKITITYTRYKDLNYIYNAFEEYDTQTVVRYVEIETDIAGEGYIELDPIDLGSYYTGEDHLNVEFEIIEISGSVSPA